MFVLNEGEYTGTVVRRTNVDGCIISTTHYSSEESNIDWHHHENGHVSFVFQGGESQTRNSSSTAQGDGGIFFYHAGETHRWISPEPLSKSANIELGSRFLNNYDITESTIKQTIQQSRSAKLLILKMQYEMLINDVNSFSALQALVLELVGSTKDVYSGTLPIWVKSLVELLNDNWNNQLSLTAMSETIDVHPVTISKYFRRYFACTLGDYLRKLKIDKSIQLIKSTEASLTEIAFHCGFSDQSHFTRTFKELTGFLPKDFRKF